ncbi:MAG: lytic murein transglycosylase, partial [Rubrivivax sp.]
GGGGGGGGRPPPPPPHDGPLALVELEDGGRPPVHYAGTGNFYAVTRYNWSSYYAMAVILLAEALRAAA